MFIPVDTVPGCIGDSYFQTLFNNLEYFDDCINGSNLQVICNSVEESDTALLKRSFGPEACVTLQEKDLLLSPTLFADNLSRKVLIANISATYSARYNDSDNPGNISRSVQAYIRCDGDIVHTITSQQLDFPVIFSDFECPPNSEVQVCVQVRQTNTGSAILQGDSTFTINVCGSLVCFDNIINQQAGSANYFPATIRDGCCYSRDAVHLINQNLLALSGTLASSSQIPSCQTLSYDNGDENTIINTAPTETTYLILGRACVTAQNASTSTSATVNVEPRFTCQSERIGCNSASRTISATGGDGPRSGTVCADIVICGTCAAGDSLTVSLRSELVCNESPSQIVTGSQTRILDIEQNYCVFLFRRPVFDLGTDLVESIGSCFDQDIFEAINERMRALNEACESRSPVELGTQGTSGEAAPGDCVLLVPPAPTDPDNPASNRKLYMLASMTPRVNGIGGLNTEGLRRVRVTYEVRCGGNVIATRTTTWTLASSGIVRQTGPSGGFSECIECPSDQPIEICFDSESLTPITPSPDQFFYQFQFFNFF